MQIHIHAPHVPVSDAFHEYAEARVGEVLGLFEDRLTRVEVHIQDQNGQKGGVDLRCVAEARPRGLDPVVAEMRGDHLRETFSGALEKLRRVLDHQLGKLAAKRRPEV